MMILKEVWKQFYLSSYQQEWRLLAVMGDLGNPLEEIESFLRTMKRMERRNNIDRNRTHGLSVMWLTLNFSSNVRQLKSTIQSMDVFKTFLDIRLTK